MTDGNSGYLLLLSRKQSVINSRRRQTVKALPQVCRQRKLLLGLKKSNIFFPKRTHHNRSSSNYLRQFRSGLQNFGNFGGYSTLTATFCEGGTLFGANAGPLGLGFAICTNCGYSDLSAEGGDGRQALPPGFETHPPLWTRKASGRCWKPNTAPVLRNKALGAETDTDVLQILLETTLTRFSESDIAERIASSLGHALRLSGAALLEVDPREISSTVVGVGRDGWGIHLFDSAAGGSGHIATLLEDQALCFRKANTLLRGDADHDRRCGDACLTCLLDAQSQGDFELGKLDRALTLTFLEGARLE